MVHYTLSIDVDIDKSSRYVQLIKRKLLESRNSLEEKALKVTMAELTIDNLIFT
ncbi:MAG: hypothetical protein RMX97_05075 [Nostoc sp. DedQUE11]|nr:hypothetical protein [Nostoc sp. DedQUE11]